MFVISCTIGICCNLAVQESGPSLGTRDVIIFSLICWAEYCERYAKKEHIMNSTGEELSDEEDVSDEESGSSDEEDEIAGHVDP